MRIGFIGAASTGKTTVADRLRHLIPEQPVPSIVREVMQRYTDNEKTEANLTPEQRLTIQRAIFEAKLKQDNKIVDGIFDRTPLDHIAYLTIKCQDIVSDTEYDDMIERAYNALEWYDAIIFFPPYRQIAYYDDGFRRVGRAYQQAQHSIMLTLLEQGGFPYFVLPFSSPGNRADMVKNYVQMIRKQGKPSKDRSIRY